MKNCINENYLSKWFILVNNIFNYHKIFFFRCMMEVDINYIYFIYIKILKMQVKWN